MSEAFLFDILLLFVGGLTAGFLGGLLGIGGGIILIPLLRFGVDLPPAAAAATCIVAVFFTTLGGSCRHHRAGNLKIRPLIPVLAAGAATTVLFSSLFTVLAVRGAWMDLAMAFVFALVSARMLWEGVFPRSERPASPSKEAGGTLVQKGVVGVAGGILPGLLGIGTGGILVPAFTFWLRMPIKAAMAGSLLCFSANAFISASFKLAQGFVVLEVVPALALGTLLGADLGARVNGRFRSRTVKLLFGLVFAYVSVRLGTTG